MKHTHSFSSMHATSAPSGARVFYHPSPDKGLTSTQVSERIEAGLVNEIPDQTSRTIQKIICSNIFTYFNLIFLILAAILIYEGSYNNLTFLLVVTVNSVIGIVQEIRAKKALDDLNLVSAPEITVIRNGEKQRIPGSQLVLEDIVQFSAGNQICADAVVCTGELSVNESLVTGESDEIKKRPGDSLLSGSFIVSGSASCRLTSVGTESFAARLSADAKKIKKKQQPGMMKSLTRLIQVIGIIVIPFGTLMFWNQHIVLGLPEKLSVEHTAASIIGMIPEGLYLLTSVALAASSLRLAKKQTLVHNMKCIEALARVDTLCVDKTGTITQAQMNVEDFLPLEEDTGEQYKESIAQFVNAMSADNETMRAMKNYFRPSHPVQQAYSIKRFSSATKYSAVDFGSGGAFVLGAPEILMPTPPNSVQELVARYTAHGHRVLLFASYTFISGGEDDLFHEGDLGHAVTPLALVMLSNAIRPHASETFAYFQRQGVTVKVISGDNPMTASAAAEKAGIPCTEKYIDLSSFDGDLDAAASEYTVFGRVTPEQKRQLVRALKKQGHTVAMTGDGVNDVLALKDADCSIAMGSGSEAAANVSDLVLLNSDFSGMPSVVAEGRRVINNIQRSASLFLVKNIFSFILSLISLISVSLYPLKPAQISLVSALMIGVPSFILALEPNTELVRGKFLRNVLFRAFPAALTAIILVEWSLLFTDAFSIAPELASTIGFYLYSFAAYLMLWRVCQPLNIWHKTLCITMGLLFFSAVVGIPEWFQIASLDYKSYLILSPLLLLTLPIDYSLHLLFAKCVEWKNRAVNHLKPLLKSLFE